MKDLNAIYVEGLIDSQLYPGKKELMTVTIDFDLALKMLTDYLGLEYAFEDGKPVIRKKK